MDLISFFVLIVLSGLFSSSETALFSLHESQVRLMIKKKEWNSSLIYRLRSDPQRLLTTLLLGNTIVNIMIGSLATVRAIEHADSIGIGFVTGIATLFVLLFGEIFPKSYAIMHKQTLSQFVAYPTYFFYILFYPLTGIFVWIEQKLRKATNAPKRGLITEEEIRAMSDLGLEHGEIDHNERQMIENIFNFDDIPVGKIMTLKSKMEALSGDASVTQIVHHISQSGFSRFPVYEKGPTNFIGYVHTNDVLRTLSSDDRECALKNIITPLPSVDEKTPIRDVFRKMTLDRTHLSLVHKSGFQKDIIGLVSMEDIIEEIVGEIEDEGDRRSELGQGKGHASQV